MTRILHLLTGQSGEACGALAALVADTLTHEPGEHHVLLLGGEALRDTAAHAGIVNYTLLPEPAGLALLLPRLNTTLSRIIRQADRLDCWTLRAIDHARLVGGAHIQPRYAPAALVDLAERYADTGRLERCDRDAVRSRWDVEPQTRVMAMLGQYPAQGETPHTALAMLMAQDTLDCRAAKGDAPAIEIRLLIHPEHQHRADAQTTLSLSGHTRLLIQEPQLTSPWEVLPACDAALVAPGSGPPGLRSFWATRAGLAVLAPRSDRPRDIARAMIEWIDETDASTRKSDRMIQSA